MNAIILAGGEGRRLKPVSGSHPKPMVPFLGRPILEYVVLLLKAQGFDRLCMTLRYQAEQIQDYFQNGAKWGVEIKYCVEDSPLGTAGGVKNCRSFIREQPFLVISGDAICDLPLHKLMELHCSRNADVSVALCKNDNPLRYGLAVTDHQDQIRCFIEKPDWPRVVSDRVNTGIYLLSPHVLDLIPDNRPFDFAQDLFPLLLEQGHCLLGAELDGYWCDVGTPLSYYRCCVDALEGRLQLDLSDGFRTTAETAQTFEVKEKGVQTICICQNRAALMGALSRSFLEMGADYSDGIRVEGKAYRMHIAPLINRSAVRISVEADNAEFAKRLAFSAGELAAAFHL